MGETSAGFGRRGVLVLGGGALLELALSGCGDPYTPTPTDSLEGTDTGGEGGGEVLPNREFPGFARPDLCQDPAVRETVSGSLGTIGHCLDNREDGGTAGSVSWYSVDLEKACSIGLSRRVSKSGDKQSDYLAAYKELMRLYPEKYTEANVSAPGIIAAYYSKSEGITTVFGTDSVLTVWLFERSPKPPGQGGSLRPGDGAQLQTANLAQQLSNQPGLA